MTNIATIPISQPSAQVVDTRYTQDVIPVLDTGKFEHMQRIASAMAKCSTIPDSFRLDKEANELPEETVIANCFRVVNQAVRWGFDPFAVMDCASIIHGKLMWEGKLVAAVIDAKLGIKLNYEFNNNKGQELGVVVSGQLPSEATPRTIDGQVKHWHKGPKSPWANEGDWKRQLRYRGAREWCRAHTPAVLLGIYADDELYEIASLDVPAGRRAQRMKDVTPTPAKALEIPDDLDGGPPANLLQPSKAAELPLDDDEDPPIENPDQFLEALEDSFSACSTNEERDEVIEANEGLVARLPAEWASKAEKLLNKNRGKKHAKT